VRSEAVLTEIRLVIPLMLACLVGIPPRVWAQPASQTSSATRQHELKASLQRFQRTPAPPDIDTLSGKRPRAEQADPLAFQRALTTIHYRQLRPRSPHNADTPLAVPRKLSRTGVRTLDLGRPRTGLANPTAVQGAVTTADRWEFARQDRAEQMAAAVAAREARAKFAPQTINSGERRTAPALGRRHPRKPPNAQYTRFPAGRARPEPSPTVAAPSVSRGLTFNHNHVAPNRRVPARHGRVDLPPPDRKIPDRWFRHAPSRASRR